MITTINIKPMTFNSAYPTNRQGRRFLSSEGKRYKAQIIAATPRLNLPPQGQLTFKYIISGPFITLKGTISKTAGDLDGFAKLLLDAVCEAAEVDDSRVFRIEAQKLIAQDWSVSFELAELLP